MKPASDIDRYFDDGWWADAVDGYRPRQAQQEMAAAVATALSDRQNLLVEAGTGTGKTYAYLLPLIVSGKRGIVSTGTRNLQDQLYLRDIPKMLEIIGVSRRIAMLKGRRNYVCPYRLEKHLQTTSSLVSRLNQANLVTVREWSSQTLTGDLSEVIDTESASDWLPLVTSTIDNCLGHRCPQIDRCPLYRAREKALVADIVVINHHLLLADLANTDDAATSLLPGVDVLVLDEAHQLAAISRQFFGHRVSSRQFAELTRDIEDEVVRLGREDDAVLQASNGLLQAIEGLAVAWNKMPSADVVDLFTEPEARAAIETVNLALAAVVSTLDSVRARSREYEVLCQRALKLTDSFALLTELDPEMESRRHVHWVDRSPEGFGLHLSPLSVAEDLAAFIGAPDKAWIFCSATMSVDGQFDYVRAQLGIEEADTLQLQSPFDFSRQVAGWVPRIEALPGTQSHTRTLIHDICLPLLSTLPRKALMLFTSYRALHMAAEMLAEHCRLSCWVQGTASRDALLRQFKDADKGVLLATQSFWEGIDVRGAGLSLLVIDKLPFPSPGDPVAGAIMASMDADGGNGFRDYSLPEAVTTLRQGFGRLIREETDRGLFVLGDSRVLSKPYGRAVLDSLPPIRWLQDLDEARATLEQTGYGCE